MKFTPKQLDLNFYQFSCKNWLQKKQVFKELIENTSDLFSHKNSNNDDNLHHTSFFFEESNNLAKKISFIISDEIKKFKEESEINFEVNNGWFQIYNKSHSHNIHNHGFKVFTAIIFINFIDSIHKPPHFISPFYNVRGYSDVFWPDVKEGDVLFFPGYINHFVPENTSGISRITASLNLTLV